MLRGLRFGEGTRGWNHLGEDLDPFIASFEGLAAVLGPVSEPGEICDPLNEFDVRSESEESSVGFLANSHRATKGLKFEVHVRVESLGKDQRLPSITQALLSGLASM